MEDIITNEYVQSVLVSLLCGCIVGLEREYKNKSAGLRTLILICFGSTIFTMASKLGDLSDDRIAANIVTGIGFLGAGVIYQGKFSVQGLTTAAVIWTMAAVGVVVGFGQYTVGVGLSVVMVLILSGFQKIENLMSDIYLTKTIYITFVDHSLEHVNHFHEFMDQNKISYARKAIEKDSERISVVYEVSGNRQKIKHMNEQIIGLQYVYNFSNMER